jgi:TRAP-type C4-dicarboxylate transport system substrate-binding protein
MKRQSLLVLVMFFLAAVGWLEAAVLFASNNTIELRAMNAEMDASSWKRKASKAYAELLKARAGGNNATVLVPKGSTIECTMKSGVKCEAASVYPPSSY